VFAPPGRGQSNVIIIIIIIISREKVEKRKKKPEHVTKSIARVRWSAAATAATVVVEYLFKIYGPLYTV